MDTTTWMSGSPGHEACFGLADFGSFSQDAHAYVPGFNTNSVSCGHIAIQPTHLPSLFNPGMVIFSSVRREILPRTNLRLYSRSRVTAKRGKSSAQLLAWGGRRILTAAVEIMSRSSQIPSHTSVRLPFRLHCLSLTPASTLIAAGSYPVVSK